MSAVWKCRYCGKETKFIEQMTAERLEQAVILHQSKCGAKAGSTDRRRRSVVNVEAP